MKKRSNFYLILFCLMLGIACGCASSAEDTYIEGDPFDVHRVGFHEREKSYLAQEQIDMPMDMKNVDIENTWGEVVGQYEALDIGLSMLEQRVVSKRFALYTILHSTEDDVWIYTYARDEKDLSLEEQSEGGLINIAIDGRTGDIIIGWLEE